jgi:hypothetical protein
MPKSYRRKTTLIKAARWDGSLECARRISAALDEFRPDKGQRIHIVMNRERTAPVELTIEDQWICRPGDYIVLSKGMLFPCSPDFFEQTFELVEEPESQASSPEKADA